LLSITKSLSLQHVRPTGRLRSAQPHAGQTRRQPRFNWLAPQQYLNPRPPICNALGQRALYCVRAAGGSLIRTVLLRPHNMLGRARLQPTWSWSMSYYQGAKTPCMFSSSTICCRDHSRRSCAKPELRSRLHMRLRRCPSHAPPPFRSPGIRLQRRQCARGAHAR